MLSIFKYFISHDYSQLNNLSFNGIYGVNTFVLVSVYYIHTQSCISPRPNALIQIYNTVYLFCIHYSTYSPRDSPFGAIPSPSYTNSICIFILITQIVRSLRVLPNFNLKRHLNNHWRRSILIFRDHCLVCLILR